MEVSSDGYDLSRKQKTLISSCWPTWSANDSRPVKLFTTFLLTLGQMAAVAVLCATRLEGRERVFAIVWSLLLAGITLLRRRTVRQRAGHAAASGIRRSAPGGLLARAQAAHRRKRAARRLRRPAPFLPASCGRLVEERADALYIYCGGTIFDIIPAEAFKNAEAMQRFARDPRGGRAGRNARGKRRTPFRLRRPTSPGRWTKSSFSTAVHRVPHAVLPLSLCGRATFIRLAASVAAVVNLMANRTPLGIAASAVVLLVANLEEHLDDPGAQPPAHPPEPAHGRAAARSASACSRIRSCSRRRNPP